MAHTLVRTFHSTCMVNDYYHTVDRLGRLAGLRVLEFSDQEMIGRRGGMTWIGDGSIEVAQPIIPGHASDRFLQRFGPGMHSLAFQISDLDGTIDHLAEGGVNLGIKLNVRPGRDFCFTDPRSTGGLLFEWSNFTVDEDPRIGAPVPPYTVEPLLDVRTHAFAGAVVADPIEWAETFGPLFGLVETFRHPQAALSDPVIGLAASDSILALYRLPGDRSVELWATEHPRARCHILGLGVDDLGEAARSVEQAGIRILWRNDSSLALDPVATGEVPLVLIEGLLPGDPRTGSEAG